MSLNVIFMNCLGLTPKKVLQCYHLAFMTKEHIRSQYNNFFPDNLNPMYPLIRPFLFTLAPEKAHHLTLRALALMHRLKLTRLLGSIPQHPQTVMGLTFPNPVGLAAGMG